MVDLSEAIERLQPPLRVEAFNHIEAGKADFMAMIVRDPEPGVAEILGQQMQDQTAEDICLVVNEAADELTALREKVAGLKGALQNIADGWPFPVAEARRALLDLQGGEDAH